MASPTTRTELKTYIRRRLGEPVITVNVADEQLEERIDDALAFYQDYHYDASEKTYLKHQLTYSNVVFTVATTGTFANNELLTSNISSAVGKVISQPSSTRIQFHYTMATPAATFQVGETVTGSVSGATGVIQEIQLGDWDAQWIPISDMVLNIYRVIPVDGFAVDRGTGLFSWNYQFMMNDLSWLSSSSVISYQLTRSHMEMLNDMFIGDVMLRFNRHVNRLYLDIDWNHRVRPGDYLVVECQRVLDPATYANVWKDRFLRDYATALTKKQWGQNLMKLKDIPLPGGVTLNGQEIYAEGEREAQELEDNIQMKYELPPEFFMA